MIAQAENLCLDDRITKPADHPSMTTSELTINPELKNLLPPLSAEEFAGLEADILKNGCLSDIVAWDDTVVDGHHRYDICTKHRLSFGVKNVHFESLDEAKLWICKHQANRRNLTPYHRGELALKFKDVVAAKAKERQGQRNDLRENNIPSKSAECKETRQELAQIANLAPSTLSQIQYISEHADEETKENLRRGVKGTSINMEYNRLTQRVRKVTAPSPAADETDKQLVATDDKTPPTQRVEKTVAPIEIAEKSDVSIDQKRGAFPSLSIGTWMKLGHIRSRLGEETWARLRQIGNKEEIIAVYERLIAEEKAAAEPDPQQVSESEDCDVPPSPEAESSASTANIKADPATSVKHVDESFEYQSPYTELPRNKDGVEVIPPLPSTTSPMPRVIPASTKNWPHENEDTIIIDEGEKEETEPLYYGGFRPTLQCPCPSGYGSRPIGATTLRHIPREHPNRLTACLFEHFPPGYVVEMVLDAMQQIQQAEGYGPHVTDWIMRQLNQKYGSHAEFADVENSDVLSSKRTPLPNESSGESNIDACPTKSTQQSPEGRFNDCTPGEFVQNLITAYPTWFTLSVLGALFVSEQEKRFRELMESNGSKRRGVDPIIAELFHRLDRQGRKVTFGAMFDKLLREEGNDGLPKLIKLMEDMTQKIHQLQAAKSKSNSQTF